MWSEDFGVPGSSGVIPLKGHTLALRRSSKTREYQCRDCEAHGPIDLFSTGAEGCPGRPESLSVLTVCAGGDKCDGHMAQDSAEWRQWKASPSMSSGSVPRYQCKAQERGDRAAEQFQKFASRIGMDFRNWAPNRDVFDVAADGVKVADFDHTAGHYELWVSRSGMLTPIRTGEAA